MSTYRQWTILTVFSIIPLGGAAAEEIRYYEKDGVTYCETRRVVQQQVPETRLEQRAQTVYCPRYTTELKGVTRTYWTPVTEYETKPVLVGRWNPLADPYWEYRTTPRTRWEQRVETVNVPVSGQQLVAETRMVNTPVTTWKTVEQEVITRVAVSGQPTVGALAGSPLTPPATLPPSLAPIPSTANTGLVPVQVPELAKRDAIGGVSRLESDPPRRGLSPATATPLRR